MIINLIQGSLYGSIERVKREKGQEKSFLYELRNHEWKLFLYLSQK